MEKKDCLLVQFPLSVRAANFPQLAWLMATLRNHDPGNESKIARGFRHSSFYTAIIVIDLLEAYGLGMVIHDKVAAASSIDSLGKDFRYLRFQRAKRKCSIK